MFAFHLFMLISLSLGQTPIPTTGQKLAPPNDSVQDIIFFSQNRPLLIRLHVYIDGKPFHAVWRDFMKNMFTHLDYNADGVLNADEVKRIPLPQFLYTNDSLFAESRLNQIRNRVVSMRTMDQSPADGKATLQELMNAYRLFGGGPFQVQLGTVQGPATQVVNDSVFQFVDENRDGQWSKEELAAASDRLADVDQDEDETLAWFEFSAMTPPPMMTPTANPEEDAVKPLSNDAGPFTLVIPGAQSRLRFRRQFLTHYAPLDDSANQRHLDRKQSRMDQASFDRLDQNKDAKLDVGEIESVMKKSADIECTVRVGDRHSGEPLLHIHATSNPEGLALKMNRLSDGGIALEFDSLRLELRSRTGWDPSTYLANSRRHAREYFQEKFKSSDANKDGILEETEVADQQVLKGLFSRMDRDPDGKLTEKEVSAYVITLQDLQIQSVLSVASAAVYESQGSFFDRIDANHDGRLTIREFKESAAKVSTWDFDGDGRLGRHELVRTFQLDLSKGISTAARFGNTPTTMPALAKFSLGKTADPTSGPLWFRKMDRNGDGDVSRREFLGAADAFRRLDADADGLVSRKEADDADATLRR